jgi:hypothetical protein
MSGSDLLVPSVQQQRQQQHANLRVLDGDGGQNQIAHRLFRDLRLGHHLIGNGGFGDLGGVSAPDRFNNEREKERGG